MARLFSDRAATGLAISHSPSDRHNPFRINLKASEVDIRVRISLIPEYTATEENLSHIAAFVSAHDLSPLSLLPYNPSGIDKWRKMGVLPPVRMPGMPMDLGEYERWSAFFTSCF